MENNKTSDIVIIQDITRFNHKTQKLDVLNDVGFLNTLNNIYKSLYDIDSVEIYLPLCDEKCVSVLRDYNDIFLESKVKFKKYNNLCNVIEKNKDIVNAFKDDLSNDFYKLIASYHTQVDSVGNQEKDLLNEVANGLGVFIYDKPLDNVKNISTYIDALGNFDNFGLILITNPTNYDVQELISDLMNCGGQLKNVVILDPSDDVDSDLLVTNLIYFSPHNVYIHKDSVENIGRYINFLPTVNILKW